MGERPFAFRERPHRPYAIVIGVDCLQGLQSARILAARGIPVIGVARDPSHYAVRTRACERVLFTDTGGPKLIALLEQLGPSFAEPPVLLPCQDKNVAVLSRARERLEQWYRIALPPSHIVDMLMDKASFHEHAVRTGLPVPATYVLRRRQDAERAAALLPHPSILKPSVRLREWSKHTKIKALIADTPGELLAHYDRLSAWAEVLVAQELIRGGDRNHVTCNCYFDRHGKPAVAFTTRKIRQWPPRTGQACSSEEVRDDTAVDLTLRVFGSVDYHGLAYLEMKRDEATGRYAIIEANIGRPTGRSAAAESAGVELLYTMYCDTIGLPLPEHREQQYLGAKWLHLMRDLQAAAYHRRRGELTLVEWWRSIAPPRMEAIASWRDPSPFVRAVAAATAEAVSSRWPGKRARDGSAPRRSRVDRRAATMKFRAGR